ncbi:MAG: hypothetical protein GY842_21180 [bacterium]|nr:hypothetical protein [bacterium]
MSDELDTHHQDQPGLPMGLTVAPPWQALLKASGWETLDDLFAVPNDGSLSKAGLPPWRERLRVRLAASDGQTVEVYIKRFRGVPLSQQLQRWWTGAPAHGTAWTEWKWLGELARADLGAPEPIAYAEEVTFGWERRSALVMGAARGVSLERWCAEHRTALPQSVLASLAELVARFHSLGIAHRDLYLAHVFAHGLEEAKPELSLIDLQRVIEMGWRARRWMVKDLAALNYSTPPWAASPRARLRWLKWYLRMRKSLSEWECAEHVGDCLAVAHGAGAARLRRQERVLARWISGKTEQIRRHDARRRSRV